MSTSLALSGARLQDLPSSKTSAGARRTLRAHVLHDRLAFAALIFLGVLIALAAGADLVAANFFRYTATQQNLLEAYTRPELGQPAFWLGTDEFGRSVVVRLFYGARVSLGVGIGAALLNLVVGVPLGLASGYYRGWLDDAVQWIISTLHAIPSISLLLVVAVLFAPGPIQLVFAVGCLTWPNVALYVRGQTLSLRGREFVLAAQVVGAPGWRVVFGHLLPNVVGLVITLSAIDVGGIMLLESSLSFLGLGIQPPTPSWGNMLTSASQTLARAPWLTYGPGSAIFLTVLSLYLVGDALRDALDPRVTGSISRPHPVQSRS